MGSILTRSSALALAAAFAVACSASVASSASAQSLGRTTSQGTIKRGPPLDPTKPSFPTLVPGARLPRIVRELPRAKPQGRRSKRRRSLSYFGHLTDFQVTDEESPARVEMNAPLLTNSSSWRPQEALLPAVVELGIRQLNHFTAASPHRAAKGRRAAMDFALVTGDQGDNQQENEATWVRRLLEGRELVDPNSGTGDYSRCGFLDRAYLNNRPDDEPQRYTGVQDYSDYHSGRGDEDFYDPNRPAGSVFAFWPQYQGLLDRAQQAFMPVGIRRGTAPVPTYVTNGNHDTRVQGNTAGDTDAERVATGCFKPFLSSPTHAMRASSIFRLGSGFAVPPDDRRRLLDRVEVKRVYSSGAQTDGHGFRFVDPGENQASGFAAGYYAWDPKPGLRFISLDTVSEGGSTVESPQGNLDNPQFQWLAGELARARAAGKLIVVFGHHPIRTMTSPVPEEAAGPCSGRYVSADGPYVGDTDRHGHDRNPSCDLDPRDSSPVHLGPDLAALLSSNENVIAYLSGHSHANRVLACGTFAGCGRRGNWWEITTSAAADWPQQQRLVELMDNRDGTLSFFGTPIDHGATVAIPPPQSDPQGTAAFTEDQLASLARTFAHNDPRAARGAPGRNLDTNVELIVADPRAGPGAGLCAPAT
ncbi:MAG: metallophosphoesterase, partial [Actinomycetota bacterium]|nr:metallophosphoesterase [Actinomycetota bacterium]